MSKLEKLLKYVSEHNEFYKKLIKEDCISNPLDITQYPILTRQLLQENRYGMFSDGYKSKYFSQQLRRRSSSGSSGIPVNVYWDNRDWYAANMSVWRKRIQWYGIHPKDRYIKFLLTANNTSAANDKNFYITNSQNCLSINMTLVHKSDCYYELINIIEKFSPKWLQIQPSVLSKLIDILSEKKISPPSSICYIETLGELLTQSLKRRATSFFQVPIINMYGSEEINGIAYECPKHHMHVLEDNVFIEVKTNKGIFRQGEGEAIITNLNNFGMPLIRYNQGDVIILDNNDIQCVDDNSGKKIISIIKGRTYNCVVLPSGFQLTSFVLLESIADVNNRMGDVITNFKFYYLKSDNKLQCFVKIPETQKQWFANIKSYIIDALISRIPKSLEVKLEVINWSQDDNFEKKYSVLEIRE